jgi:hypothetical protein
MPDITLTRFRAVLSHRQSASTVRHNRPGLFQRWLGPSTQLATGRQRKLAWSATAC